MHYKNILLLAALTFGRTHTQAQSPEAGKQIFQSRCASCHNVNKQLTGPALANVDKRRSTDWIIHFVHSSQTVVKNGDAYANELFLKFNQTVMPDHPDLTEAQIKDIIAYIHEESKNFVADKPPFDRPTMKAPPYLPPAANDYGFFVGYIGVVLLLILVLLFAVQVKSTERDIREKGGR